MHAAASNDLDLKIAQARVLLSVLALVSWYIDPSNGGWFFIDESSLVIFTLHLAYSLAILLLIGRGMAPPRLFTTCAVLDIAFAAVVTVVTEGHTSPSQAFFIFAIVEVNCRTGFRAAVSVTICSALLYFLLLAVYLPGHRHDYLMRSAYLAIIGYLIGFIGEQRARFEARVHELESAAQRQTIARALHDGYVQALAGVNLRLETCRTLIKTARPDEALDQLTDLQKGVAREYDSVRAYIRSLAAIERAPGATNDASASGPVFRITADFAGDASLLEQVLHIVLEGVRNIRRHAEACRATINIDAIDDAVRIVMRDDGVGFHDSAHAPWTIASRVAESGGRIEIGGAEEAGALLTIEIPAA